MRAWRLKFKHSAVMMVMVISSNHYQGNDGKEHLGCGAGEADLDPGSERERKLSGALTS